MNSVSLSVTGELASELHALLRETDPARWTDRVAERARERWARIKSYVETLGERQASSALDTALADLATVARELPAEAEGPPEKSYWMQLRARLMPVYEQIAAQLRAKSVSAPTLRPTNWHRIAFHVSSALGALALLEIILTKNGTLWATGLFAGTCWFLETGRAISVKMNDRLMRVRFFELIIHPHEQHHVNSATWYGTALFILAVLSPSYASAAALAVLGLGDPLAGLVGRRWGKHPILGGRTWEGSVAFVFGGTLAAFAVLAVFHRTASLPMLLAVAVVAAIAGAGAEVLSKKVDDNLSVPLAAAAGAWLTTTLLGLI
jgi:dolichol kinase